MTVHATINESPLCGFSNDLLVNWPEGNTGIPIKDTKKINCPTCKERALIKVRAAPKGMYRILSILLTDKKDVRVIKDINNVTNAFIICSKYNVEHARRKYYCFDDNGQELGNRKK